MVRILALVKNPDSYKSLPRLEPLLYRVIVILDDAVALRLKDRLKCKSTALWRDGPRLLFLSIQSDPNLAAEILSKFTGLEDLMLYCDRDRPREFMPQLEAMKLRRLGVDLGDLFGSHAHMDLSGPAFAHVTHLLLMDSDIDGDAADIWVVQLAHLPALTYLALIDDAPAGIMLSILEQCTPLCVLVNLRSDFRRHTVQWLACELRIEDPRFVILQLNMFTEDWEAGANGYEDFWARADEFVTKKRGGRSMIRKMVTALDKLEFGVSIQN
ncbi:hypothetical protein DFH07DRAFT_783318 [Mycena maculata]|uniref:Uncharacterized protein n=1 Tax=Mycena maculata TaxID=230809 RepID=A0AAD7HN17_9AGAR|nr:hypothetical protein DFH07DRAFT_783318 [Mycena maculata]